MDGNELGSEGRCTKCQGALFTPAELARHAPGYAEALQLETDLDSGAFAETRRCPSCDGAMAPWRFEQMRSWVERCPVCERYWLDAADQKNAVQISRRLARQAALASLPERDRQSLASSLAGSLGEAPIQPFHRALALLGFPVVRGRERVRTPWVTLGLVMVLVLTHVRLVTQEIDPLELAYRLGDGWWPLFTASFLHDGWLHLIGNVYFLIAFGDGVEQRLPRALYLLLFVSFGAASLFIEAWLDGPQTRILGASGAISALIGLSVMLEPKAKIVFGIWVAVFKTSLLTYALAAMAIQALLMIVGVGGTAWAAHLSGLALGLAAGKLLNRARD